MKRLFLVPTIALMAFAFLVGPPAQAATQKGNIKIGWDAFGLSEGGVSYNAFVQACSNGLVEEFMGSPLQGVDGYAFDLGSEKMGAFSVKGPGASPVGPEVQGIQFATYDLDLHFLTAECEDANASESNGKCYSTSEEADENTGCIKGFKAGGKVHGARYVVVTMAINLGVVPVDITLTHP
jgi:hypothetical protein